MKFFKTVFIFIFSMFLFLSCSSNDSKKSTPPNASVSLDYYHVVWGGSFPVLQADFVITNSGGGTLNSCKFEVFVRTASGDYKILNFQISGLGIPSGMSSTLTLKSLNEAPGNYYYDWITQVFHYNDTITVIQIVSGSIVIS